MSATTRVFVTGAAGNVGSSTVKHLLYHPSKRAFIRCGVHSEKDLSQFLRNYSVETMRIDFDDVIGMRNAFQGFDCVLVIPPQTEDRARLGKNVVDACKMAGVKHVVLISVRDADTKEGLFAKQFSELEEYLINSGLGYTIVRPNLFMENIVLVKDFLKKGDYPHPLKNNAAFAPVCVDDVGLAVSSILEEPAKYDKKIFTLSGPEELTGNAQAEILSKCFGKKIRYVEIEPSQLKDALVDQRMPQWQAGGIANIYETILTRKSQSKTGDLAALTGKQGTRWEDFVKSQKDALVAPSAQAR